MASSGKRKTTFAKLSREARLREKRQDKEARKAARRQEALERPAELTELEPDTAPNADMDPAAPEE